MISRRTFLRESFSGLSAVAVAPPALQLLSHASRAQRVLIAGAGAAGLSAAWELKRAGHEVLVFEPRMVPGGRILTLRSPFADGLYAEAGALYLASDSLAAQYAREFGLELTPVQYRADLGSLAYVAGARVEQRTRQAVRWPAELGPVDAGQSIIALQNRYFRSSLAQVEGGLEGLNAADWPRPTHLPYDDVSLAELWRRNGASEAAIRLMRLNYYDLFGEGVESVSALQLLRVSGMFVRSTGLFQIRGGNDLLPRAFAERLGSAVRYGTQGRCRESGRDRRRSQPRGCRWQAAGAR
jgi:monoamine oxidase